MPYWRLMRSVVGWPCAHPLSPVAGPTSTMAEPTAAPPRPAKTGAADHALLLMLQTRYAPVPATFLSTQGVVTADNRRIVVQWMLELAVEYSLHEETYEIAVVLFDRYLSNTLVELSRLQLIGLAAFLLAWKIDEDRVPPALDELVRMTDGTFTRAQLVDQEFVLLHRLDHRMMVCTATSFVAVYRRNLRSVAKFDELVSYILMVSMEDDDMYRWTPPVRALASIVLARILLHETPFFSLVLEVASGLRYSEVESCIGAMSLKYRECVARTGLNHCAVRNRWLP